MSSSVIDAVVPYPRALCEGVDEVREAFRALQAFNPTREAPSTIEQIGRNQYVVEMQTRYVVPGYGGEGFVVPSVLIVTTVSEEAAEARASAATGEGATGEGGTEATVTTLVGRIERVEERWNGARLLEGFPFSTMRRAVGLASFAATPVLFPPGVRE